MALQPLCEYIDRSGTRLVIAVWLRGRDAPAGSRFTLRLRTRSGRHTTVAHATVSSRVNTFGVWTNSALTFEVDCADLPAGAYRLDLSPAEAPGYVRVQPTTGVLANSRPEAVGDRRIQVLPAAGRPLVWLRISSWSPRERLAWSLRNVVREVAFIAHGRRFFWVRAARLLTRPFVPRGAIWLIGERPETARDNGRALFRYLRTHRPDANVYYVVAAKSPMRSAVAPLGNVVHHSSWRHRILMLHADVLANAYSIKHMLPSRWHPGAYMKQCAWRLGALRVYLKHGVHLSPYALKRANGGYDLLATVGPGETRAIAGTSGYGDQLAQTGLARYDDLGPQPPSRTILLMMTWRRYLVPTLFSGDDSGVIPYAGSTYQEFVDGFLGSERLRAMLESADANLLVVPHYNLAPVLTLPDVASERITILDGATADIPRLLRNCDLLVTDYSSVHFDVAYVGTPVIYAQFDEEDFQTGHGSTSWFDSARDGFGPVTADLDTTIDAVQHYADRAFVREPHYAARVQEVFAHRDDRNSERIAEAIDDLLPVGSGQP